MKTADAILSDALNFAFRRGVDAGSFSGSVRQIARSVSAHFALRKYDYDRSDLDAVARGEIKTADKIAADVRRARPKGTRMKLRYGC